MFLAQLFFAMLRDVLEWKGSRRVRFLFLLIDRSRARKSGVIECYRPDAISRDERKQKRLGWFTVGQC
jgi:hypothetical protein